MSAKLKFVDRGKSNFYATVKDRVEQYFSSRKISKNANFAMYCKVAFFLLGAFALYVTIISGVLLPHLWLMYACCLLLGVFGAMIGFNVSHDAIHGSFSHNAKINRLLSASFYFIGANPYMWNITHNVVHHTFTNIPGHDEDIEVAPGLIRLSPAEKPTRIQKYQHYYAFLLYGLAAISWIFRKDYKKFFQKKIGNYNNSKHSTSAYFNLFFFKFLYYFLTIAVPIILLPTVTWWQFLFGYISLQLVKGFVIGLVFQLAHVVEGTSFPEPNEEGNIEEAWAVHQMCTTANFARKNWLATFLCGGLNMQIEHHLFPKICHIHYPAISEIVRKTAIECGVPYIENKTFVGALASHYAMLKQFGAGDSFTVQTRTVVA
ncbi:MAG TPA: acyl-CoA desaturase [Cytophagales bacterium]|nr:acyl-CoA desaturase [Cytophagales bacterium]